MVWIRLLSPLLVLFKTCVVVESRILEFDSSSRNRKVINTKDLVSSFHSSDEHPRYLQEGGQENGEAYFAEDWVAIPSPEEEGSSSSTPEPWRFEQTAWYDKYKEKYGFHMHNCDYMDHIPTTGEQCVSRFEHYWCFFGTEWECSTGDSFDAVDAEPQFRCQCQAGTGTFRCEHNQIPNPCSDDDRVEDIKIDQTLDAENEDYFNYYEGEEQAGEGGEEPQEEDIGEREMDPDVMQIQQQEEEFKNEELRGEAAESAAFFIEEWEVLPRRPAGEEVKRKPWKFEHTVWWDKYKQKYGFQIRMCNFLQTIPQTGDLCRGRRQDYWCLFGTEWECETSQNDSDAVVVDAEPEYRCLCKQSTGKLYCEYNNIPSPCDDGHSMEVKETTEAQIAIAKETEDGGGGGEEEEINEEDLVMSANNTQYFEGMEDSYDDDEILAIEQGLGPADLQLDEQWGSNGEGEPNEEEGTNEEGGWNGEGESNEDGGSNGGEGSQGEEESYEEEIAYDPWNQDDMLDFSNPDTMIEEWVGLERKPAGDEVEQVDYVWENAPWWDKYKSKYGFRIRKCAFLEKRPRTGESCEPKFQDYWCLFGTEWECEVNGKTDAEPEYRCKCSVATGVFECEYNNLPKPCEDESGSRRFRSLRVTH